MMVHVCFMARIGIQPTRLTWRVAEKGIRGRICRKHPLKTPSGEILNFAAAPAAVTSAAAG